MKLSSYAKKHGITKRTAWTHFKKGLIDGAYQLPSGGIIVPDDTSDQKTVVILFSGSVQDLLQKLQ